MTIGDDLTSFNCGGTVLTACLDSHIFLVHASSELAVDWLLTMPGNTEKGPQTATNH